MDVLRTFYGPSPEKFLSLIKEHQRKEMTSKKVLSSSELLFLLTTKFFDQTLSGLNLIIMNELPKSAETYKKHKKRNTVAQNIFKLLLWRDVKLLFENLKNFLKGQRPFFSSTQDNWSLFINRFWRNWCLVVYFTFLSNNFHKGNLIIHIVDCVPSHTFLKILCKKSI